MLFDVIQVDEVKGGSSKSFGFINVGLGHSRPSKAVQLPCKPKYLEEFIFLFMLFALPGHIDFGYWTGHWTGLDTSTLAH